MNPKGNVIYGSANVAIGAVLTTLGTVTMGTEVPGQVVNLEIENTGANAFTDFRIQLMDHPDGEWYDYLLSTDLIDPTNDNVFDCSTDLSALASGAKGHVAFRVNAAYAFRCMAKRTTATTATMRGNWRGA